MYFIIIIIIAVIKTNLILLENFSFFTMINFSTSKIFYCLLISIFVSYVYVNMKFHFTFNETYIMND